MASRKATNRSSFNIERPYTLLLVVAEVSLEVAPPLLKELINLLNLQRILLSHIREANAALMPCEENFFYIFPLRQIL